MKIRPVSRVPLYVQVAGNLEEVIRTSYQPGDRLPPETEIARQFGVSIVTMREAMANLARSGVVHRRQGSGTFVAAGSNGGKVALLLPWTLNFWHIAYQIHAMAESAMRTFEEAGVAYEVYFGRWIAGEAYDGVYHYADFEQDLEAGKIRAVVLLNGLLDASLQKRIATHRIPLVTRKGLPANNREPTPRPWVGEVLDRLLEAGRSRIALIGYSSSTRNTPGVDSTFRAEAARRSVTVHNEWVRTDIHPYLDGAGWEAFREIWSARREKPDALLIADDCFFHSTASSILDLKIRVPRDLVVVSLVMRGAPQFFPFPVARVMVDPRHRGQVMAQAVLDGLAGKKHALADFSAGYQVDSNLAAYGVGRTAPARRRQSKPSL